VVALTAAVVTAGLTGCSGSSNSPTVLPPLSTTPAASASSTPAQNPKAAAVAVVREYFRLLNAPTTTATATALGELMTAECACQKVADSTRQVAERHQHYFGKTTATSLIPSSIDAQHVEVIAEYGYTASGIARFDGSIVSRSGGRVGATLDIRLTRTAQGWRIAQLVYVRQGRPR